MENLIKKHRLALIMWGIVAVIFIVLIFLNNQPFELNLIFFKLKGNTFLLALVVFALGFLSGWLWSYIRNVSRQKKEKRESQKRVKYLEK